MILIDSCGWLEFFADGPRAGKFAPYFEQKEKIVVPALVIYEVYKKIKRETTEEQALLAVGQMQQCRILPVNHSHVLSAADLSLKHSLPMADAIILACAKAENAKLITSDRHFKKLEGVKYIS
jgi:predicted nucleic acid-binding protein